MKLLIQSLPICSLYKRRLSQLSSENRPKLQLVKFIWFSGFPISFISAFGYGVYDSIAINPISSNRQDRIIDSTMNGLVFGVLGCVLWFSTPIIVPSAVISYIIDINIYK
jgi:hypothetical protein